MKIVLATLPIFDETLSHPNIGLLYLSRVLKDHSHKVVWVDLVRAEMRPRQAAIEILGHQPELIAISAMVVSYRFLLELVNHLKVNRDVPIVVGGNVTATALDLLEVHTAVEFAIVGEAEISFPQLISSLVRHPSAGGVEPIAGVVSRNEEGAFTPLEPSDPPANIDGFGFPDYAAIDMEHYITSYSRNYCHRYATASGKSPDACRAFPLLTSRGCPYHCAFCFRLITRFRSHAIDYTLEHIRLLQAHYGINFISIPDELMIANRRSTLDLLEALSRGTSDVYFITGGARTDLIDAEMLEAFRKANFVMICYGVESGSQRMLDAMNKKTTVADNFNAIRLTLENDIGVYFNLVMGAPGEDDSSLAETEAFVNRACQLGFEAQDFTAHLACPFPGTDFYRHAVEKGLISDKHDYLVNLRGLAQYPVNLSGFRDRETLIAKVAAMRERLQSSRDLHR